VTPAILALSATALALHGALVEVDADGLWLRGIYLGADIDEALVAVAELVPVGERGVA